MVLRFFWTIHNLVILEGTSCISAIFGFRLTLLNPPFLPFQTNFIRSVQYPAFLLSEYGCPCLILGIKKDRGTLLFQSNTFITTPRKNFLLTFILK